MPSKYNSKLAKPAKTQAEQYSKSLLPLKHAVCTNCGRSSTIHNQHSKCKCGGTFQTYAVRQPYRGSQ